MDIPTDTFLVAYADDITAGIITRNTENAQRSLNQVMKHVSSLLEEHSVDLATKSQNCTDYPAMNPHDD